MLRHETPTPNTFSKNYTKTTALERSVASKPPGVGLKDPPLRVEYLKDIYDFSAQLPKMKRIEKCSKCRFSLVHSIPNYWKIQLKHENGLIPI